MSTAGRENRSLPRIFTGWRQRTGRCKRCSALPGAPPYLGANPFQGMGPSRRKENSSRSSRQRLRVRLRRRRGERSRGPDPLSAFRFGNIDPIPFRAKAPRDAPGSDRARLIGVDLALRTDSPMSNCCSHGTFPHFSLQSSHLNSCYYHQDLHRRRFDPGSRPGLLHHRRALLHVGTDTCSPRRPGVGATLQRHPFSGLVDSAGELLHTP